MTQAKLVSITDFGFALVFPKPNVFTCITTVEKRPQHWSGDAAVAIAKVEEPESISNVLPKFTELTQDQRDSLEWAHSSALVNRLRRSFPDLDHFCLVKDVGLNYWTVGRGKKRGGSIADRVLYQGKQQHINDRPFLKGRNIDRYQLESPSSWLKHDWPKHIDPSVDKFRFDENVLCQEKLVYRQTADHLRCALDPHEYLTDKTVHSIVWLPHRQARESYMYLLGILNSRLFCYLYQASAHEAGRTFAQVKIYRIRSMPFRPIDFSDSADKSKHNKMVKLVDRMLDLHNRLAKAKVPAEKTRIQRQINTTDNQIDKLTYELYNLSPEEIAIVEASNNKR